MTRFTDLPNEIFHEILGLVLPEDLENFASTCKQISLVSGPFLREHRQLIRQYGTLSNRGSEEEMRTEWRLRTIPTVLKNILDNPRVGRYVKKLHLGALYHYSLSRAHHEEEEVQEEAQEDHRTKVDMFRRAACQNDFLTSSHINERFWGESMLNCNEDLILVLLLTLLPNLHTLSIRWLDLGGSSLALFMKRAPTAAVPILSSLRNAHLEPRSNRHVYFKELQLLSALPSLKSLSAQGAWDHNDWENDPSSIQQSNVTHLIMPRSNVSSRSLHEYLLSFPVLHTFEYEHAVPDVGEQCRPFDPFLLRSALLSQARTTLRKMSITGPLRQKSFIGSLLAFEILREVHTNWSFLSPTGIHDRERWLSCILPASLRVLKLRDKLGRDPKEYVKLVKGLTYAKRTTCPLLEMLELAALRAPKVQDLQRACEDVGIKFVFRSDQSLERV